MKRKVLGIFLALVMILGAMATGMTPVSADNVNGNDPANQNVKGVVADKDISLTKPQTSTVVIHKLAADSYKIADKINGNGGIIDQKEFTKLGTNVEPLEGVEFHVYQITDDETWNTMETNKESYKTKTQMETLVGNNKATFIKSEKTGSDGSATFSDLAEGNYWFVEGEYKQKKNPGDADKKISNSIAVPFGITLAATNPEEVTKGGVKHPAGTVYLSTIHAYPKNTIGDVPVPEKTVDNEYNKHSNAEIGKDRTWFLQTPVPANITDYDTWEIKDTFGKGLTYLNDDTNPIRVYFKGKGADANTYKLIKETDYTIEKQPAKGAKMDGTENNSQLYLKLTSDGITKLGENYSAAQGTETTKLVPTLFVEVDTKINEDAEVEVLVPNKFDLIFKLTKDEKTTTTPSDTPDVKTGGKRFVKVDAADQETKLKDAIFQLYDGKDAMKWTKELLTKNLNNGAIIMEKQDDGSYKKVEEANIDNMVEKDIYIASGEEGKFEIVGLEYSKWEKTTKKGIEDITHNYKLTEVKAPEGYNLPSNPDTTFIVDEKSYNNTTVEETKFTEPADPLEIKNKKLVIPPVGGIGTLIFTVAGLAIMGGSLVAYKKSRKEEA